MLVSVIIPAFNAEKTIQYCLNSCILQLDFIKEIIVIDDNSTDNTKGKIEEIRVDFNDKIIIKKNIKKGSNEARNLGLAMATGDYIQFLDADDEIGRDKLQKQIDFLKKNPQYDIAYSDWEIKICDANGRKNIIRKSEKQVSDFLLKLLLDEWLPPHSYLLKHNAAKRIAALNGWNPKTKVLQDREYYTIGALLDLRFGYVVDCKVIYYRNVHLVSLSKVNVATRFESLYNLIRNFRKIIIEERIILNKQQIQALESNEILSRVMLKKPIVNRFNALRIYWKIFPGKKSILKALYSNLFASRLS